MIKTTQQITTISPSLYKARTQVAYTTIDSSMITLPLLVISVNRSICFVKCMRLGTGYWGLLLKRLQNTQNLCQEQQKHGIYLMIFTLTFKSCWREGNVSVKTGSQLNSSYEKVREMPFQGFSLSCWNGVIRICLHPPWNVSSTRVRILWAGSSPYTSAKISP